MKAIAFKFRQWDTNRYRMYRCNHPCNLMPNRVVMQYTGLNDKNGKEIFEGDIIKDKHGDLLTVVYDVDRKFAAFCGFFIDKKLWWQDNQITGELSGWNGVLGNPELEPEDIEVVGNIYEDWNVLG